jgi:hypothetical protein
LQAHVPTVIDDAFSYDDQERTYLRHELAKN